MGFPVVGLVTILPGIIRGVAELIGTVEKLVKGKGKGKEKKEMVLDAALDGITIEAESADETGVYGEYLMFDGKYNWGCLIKKIPELKPVVGDLIDVIVRIKNILKECDE